jgi:hypothetical protein
MCNFYMKCYQYKYDKTGETMKRVKARQDIKSAINSAAKSQFVVSRRQGH